MNMFEFTIIFIVCAIGVQGQVPFLGPCPSVETVKGFDVTKYMGKWYEQERYFAIFQYGGKCVTADYNLNSNGTVGIFNQQISAITGMKSAIAGVGNIVGRADEGKISVRFPSLPVQFDAPYWVVDTDYTNYAVVWSCTDFSVFNTRNAWILTRERNPPLEVIKTAHSASKKFKIDRGFFIKTDQENCPNY